MSLFSAVFSALRLTGELRLPVDVWHKSSDTAYRLLFGNNSTTYVRSGNASGVAIEFRNSADAVVAQIPATGGLGLGTTAVTDATAAATIASGFGSSPAIAGKTYAFKITLGTGSPTSGVANFGVTFASAPIVVVSSDATGALVTSVSTTQVSLTFTTQSTVLYVLVRGY